MTYILNVMMKDLTLALALLNVMMKDLTLPLDERPDPRA